MSERKRLGDLLREQKQISPEDLYAVIQDQEEMQKAGRLGEMLLERNLVPKANLAAALAEVLRVEYVDCSQVEAQREALRLVPRETALRDAVFPLELKDGKLVVAMAEPQNLRILDELRFVVGKELVPRLGFRTEIEAAIERHYGEQGEGENGNGKEEEAAECVVGNSEVEFFSAGPREGDLEALDEEKLGLLKMWTPAVRLVSWLLQTAVEKRASDIHIEPQGPNTVIRIRVDGILRQVRTVTGKLQSGLVSRIKVLADMDIAHRRKPQDGRFLVRVKERRVDVRVSSLPTSFGEKLVLRLLDATGLKFEFADLGYTPEHCKSLEELLLLPQGMILVTGPTGSGKSTSLYTALRCLKKPSVNIVTVEDPVEYMIEGISQVQVNPKAGLTFASSLRSILRQDPDVIMVGEIRDSETAEISLKAALTGHLVLSTLHTNDSIGAVVRLVDLGVPPYLIASSLSAVISQRLVRRLCPCRAQTEATPEYALLMLAAGIRKGADRMYVPVGCPECDNTGYKGRVGLYEILMMNDAVRAAVRAGSNVEQIRAAAQGTGIKFMQEDALHKLARGLTSLAEALRVVVFDKGGRCESCGAAISANLPVCPYCGVSEEHSSTSVSESAETPTEG